MEALTALAVLTVGVLGVAALGQAGVRQARLASARTAQVIAAQMLLESARGRGSAPPVSGVGVRRVGDADLEVRTLVTPLGPDLMELRVVVEAHGTAGPLDIVTRVATAGL